jgi:hypothetical protein
LPAYPLSCDDAKPRQILISPRVLMKVENAVKVEPIGEFELKGIRRPSCGLQCARRGRGLKGAEAGSGLNGGFSTACRAVPIVGFDTYA